ncbi:MAG: DEAD/DEAH box helicase, partial [Vicinamibacterales bacterium]
LVLLGDPQQLEQPQKGSHPDGVDISSLEHVLGAAKTMPADRGLFLPVTWRLAPAICEFTSDTFYESRLAPKTGLEHQGLTHAGPLDGAGLWWVPVEHDRNQNWSAEEIDVVDRVVSLLLAGGRWVDEDRVERPLTGEDILVVAPYNVQVNRLRERFAGLPSTPSHLGSLRAGTSRTASGATRRATGAESVRVGTVDKFQGQEAPVVIYSMASSSLQDAPRGMDFLYSLNRLNVATSRARCAVVLVASPRLFEPECRTPRQMKLANALCRYREMAQLLTIDRIEAAGV